MINCDMSIDMISYLTRMKEKDFIYYNNIYMNLPNCEFWIGTDIKKYKYNYKVDLGKSSYYIGFCHNSETYDGGFHSLKIQYNPNKVTEFDELLIRLMHYVFREKDSCLKSLDVACDLHIPYGNFIIDKALKRNINTYNGTYYIGERSNGVKIYDKQKESGLSNPLTRYELRLTFDKCQLCMLEFIANFDNMCLPTLTIIDNLDNLNDNSIDSFDKAVLLGLLEEPTLINSFSRRKKEKYKNYLLNFTQFCPNPKEILQCIKKYIKQLKDNLQIT